MASKTSSQTTTSRVLLSGLGLSALLFVTIILLASVGSLTAMMAPVVLLAGVLWWVSGTRPVTQLFMAVAMCVATQAFGYAWWARTVNTTVSDTAAALARFAHWTDYAIVLGLGASAVYTLLGFVCLLRGRRRS